MRATDAHIVRYTLGNLLSLGATSFLVGPAQQCRDMMAPQRKMASLAYVVTLGTVSTTLSYCMHLHRTERVRYDSRKASSRT